VTELERGMEGGEKRGGKEKKVTWKKQVKHKPTSQQIKIQE
jgi:hypothetical protein